MKTPSPNDSIIRETAAAWVARRDAGLSSHEEAELKAWLARDARHRAAWAEHGFAWSLLDRPTQGGAAGDVLDELRALDRRQRRRRVALGAAAALIMFGGISRWSLTRPAAFTGAPTVATARVLLPERQTLADGSVVELKDGAQFEIKFEPALRRVALIRGEAHFAVAKDPARPFVVEANGSEFRAVGTAFAVQLDGAGVAVIVTEGHVAVTTPPGNASRDPPTQAILSPGQQGLIEPGAVTATVRNVPAAELSERLAWRAPRLEFSGTPLADAVTLLNQQAGSRDGTRFALGDPSLAQVKVSGLFRADNTAALLDLLDSGFGIVGERVGRSQIILRKAPAR
jgi:transmembrane sensor